MSPHGSVPRVFQKYSVALAAAVLLAGIGTWLAIPQIALVYAERLLAVEYSQRRPFEFRLPDNGYHLATGQFPGENSRNLRKAREWLGRADRWPGVSARVYLLRGREALLHDELDRAIQWYRSALDADPSLADARIELAGAFLLQSQKQKHYLDLAQALQQMGVATRFRARSATDHFNLALVYEGIPAPHLAVQEWTAFLNGESSPDWRKEAEDRRAHWVERIASQQERARQLEHPAAFLGAVAPPYSPEYVIDAAIVWWLPHRQEDREAEQALQRLAALLRAQHSDPWLIDMLRLPPNPQAIAAWRLLAKAMQENQTGNHYSARDDAVAAGKAFQRLHSPAGQLGARAELVYALQRADANEDCLRESGTLAADLDRTSYNWLKGRVWLDKTTCEARRYAASKLVSDRLEILAKIEKTHYEGLRLRAEGFLVDPELVRGYSLLLWDKVHAGLEIYWAGEFTPIRAQQFYYATATAMNGSAWPFAAVAMAREAVLVAKELPNEQWQHLLSGGLGARELEAGLADDAAAHLLGFEGYFATHRDVAGAEQSEVQALLRRVEVEAAQAEPGPFIRRLEILRQRLKAHDQVMRLTQCLGLACLRAGEIEKAASSFKAVVEQSMRLIEGSRDLEQRHASMRLWGNAHLGMVQLLLTSGHKVEEAFEQLQRFRAAWGGDAPPPPFREALTDDAALLDVAVLPSGVAVFAADKNGVESLWMEGRQGGLDTQSREFISLCASPKSKSSDIERAAQSIYDQLIRPFEGRLLKHKILIVRADGPLQGIPWAALSDSSHQPLLGRVAVLVASGARSPAPSVPSTTAHRRPLLVVNPALSEELAPHFAHLAEADLEAEEIHTHFPDARVLAGKGATIEAVKGFLPDSSFFHFGGHGIAYGGYGAMLLASQTNRGYEGLLAAPEILRMDLHGVHLVSLAACSIGVGQSTGPVNPESLVRALLDAGVENVIAASWPVDSSTTRELFGDYYTHVSAAKLTDSFWLATVLQQTCLRVRMKRPHPFYWAAFQQYAQPLSPTK
jgi:CHAT domain-containing protein